MTIDIRALLDTCVDAPSWEHDAGDPAATLSHQLLVGVGASIGLRDVLEDRVNELLAKHDNTQDFLADLNFVTSEIAGDLQRALHGTTLGRQCQNHELESGQLLEVLRANQKRNDNV